MIRYSAKRILQLVMNDRYKCNHKKMVGGNKTGIACLRVQVCD